MNRLVVYLLRRVSETLVAVLLLVASIGIGVGATPSFGGFGMRADASDQIEHFMPCGTTTVGNVTPGAASDINTQFGIGIDPGCAIHPGQGNVDQYNFGDVVNFTPPEWGVPADADIVNGTEIGILQAVSTLGLLNNPCTTTLNIHFTFYEAAADPSGPRISPLSPGTADRMKPLREDANSNGIPDGAEAWPSYIGDALDGANLSQVRARYLGVATIAPVGNLTVILNFVVFEPGAKVSNDPTLTLDPRLGFPSVAILQDPSAPASAADLINDFCSPMLSTTTLTSAVRTNPTTDGTYNFVTVVRSARDADGDGFENQLDTCPYDPNVGNPRRKPDIGDSDYDGIDDACDPNPNLGQGVSCVGVFNTDEDGDCWMNRNDNCPLAANEDQKDTDRDGIGDGCDQHPNDANADGIPFAACVVVPVAIGIGGASAINPNELLPCNSSGAVPPAETSPPEGPTPVTVSPTTSYTPVPHLTATPTPTPALPAAGWFDLDCNGEAGGSDALPLLLYLAEVPGDGDPACVDAGTVIRSRLLGDVDCSGELGPRDAVDLLSINAGLTHRLGMICPSIDAAPIVQAVIDLSGRLGIAGHEITVLEAREVLWADNCNGAYRPSMSCTASHNGGYLMRLAAAGLEYVYHADCFGGLIAVTFLEDIFRDQRPRPNPEPCVYPPPEAELVSVAGSIGMLVGDDFLHRVGYYWSFIDTGGGAQYILALSDGSGPPNLSGHYEVTGYVVDYPCDPFAGFCQPRLVMDADNPIYVALNAGHEVNDNATGPRAMSTATAASMSPVH